MTSSVSTLGREEVGPLLGLPAEHAVLIAGAGPTGLMLAGELALAGVDAAIVERPSESRLFIGRQKPRRPGDIDSLPLHSRNWVSVKQSPSHGFIER